MLCYISSDGYQRLKKIEDKLNGLYDQREGLAPWIAMSSQYQFFFFFLLKMKVKLGPALQDQLVSGLDPVVFFSTD